MRGGGCTHRVLILHGSVALIGGAIAAARVRGIVRVLTFGEIVCLVQDLRQEGREAPGREAGQEDREHCAKCGLAYGSGDEGGSSAGVARGCQGKAAAAAAARRRASTHLVRERRVRPMRLIRLVLVVVPHLARLLRS